MLWIAPGVLAFGILRYNPLLQAYMAVLTLSGIAAIVAWHTPEPGLRAGDLAPGDVPRLFAGPSNIVRFAMLALFCAVLVAAAVRARRLLARAIAEGTRRANLTRYLPPQIVETLATISTEELMRGRRQNGAVLFIDIRGFTARAETMDTPALGRFLSAFRAIVREAVERHGGVVDKHIGDAVMVIFGLPQPTGGDARNALAAARDILAALDAWNKARAEAGEDRVAAGIGVHWGEMFAGGIGDAQRLEVTVLGDTVNVAARLQELSKRSGHPLIVSKDLLDAANEDPAAAGWAALPPQTLRGRQQAMALFGAG